MTRNAASNNPVFEIGLVMAGAVSAGAYTAGVMDFLMEALDAYYTAKNDPNSGWDGPTHDVRISVMAGASAGGMTSAISALHAFHDGFDHFWPGAGEPANPRTNRLYSSWVDDIDLLGARNPDGTKQKALLDTSDLDAAPDGVASLLCCDVIDEIVKNAFDIQTKVRTPPWVGRDDDKSLRVLMTLTNLRGVSYSFNLFGQSDPRKYGTLNHGDYLDLQVFNAADGPPPPAPGAHPLDINDTTTPGWDLYREAAKATGAFPIGLKPRLINRPREDYKYSLKVGVEVETTDSAGKITGDFVTSQPDDSLFHEPAPNPPGGLLKDYEFVTVDGGTIDNEPLEIARRLLAKGTGKAHNERSGASADRAIVMIAPFPNFQQAPTEDKGAKVIDIVRRLFFKALIEQARFKPDELQLAADEEVFSRYIISPEREGNGSRAAHDYPIACGVLGAFGGFMHKSFRRHDYLLGRRNAQQFLRNNFSLPVNNPLFDDYRNSPRYGLANWRTCDADGKPKTSKGSEMLPIIPLVRAPAGGRAAGKHYAADPIVIPSQFYPDLSAANATLPALFDAVSNRINRVVKTFIEVDLQKYTSGILKAPLRWAATQLIGDAATKTAEGYVKGAIDDVQDAFEPYEKS